MQGALDFMATVYDTFGFTFKLFLSTRPEKYLGDLNMWNDAEKVRLQFELHYLTPCCLIL